MLTKRVHLCNEITSPRLERRNFLLKLFSQGIQSYYLNTHYVNLEIQHFCNHSSSIQETNQSTFMSNTGSEASKKKKKVGMIDLGKAEGTQLPVASGITGLLVIVFSLCLFVSSLCVSISLFNKDAVKLGPILLTSF